MATRTIRECDRCKRELRGGRIVTIKGVKANGRQQDAALSADRKYDLCSDCFTVLEDWLQSRATVAATKFMPPGFKRVARPCPHHVPCAEPWGCSGDEIVRVSDPRPSLDEQGF